MLSVTQVGVHRQYKQSAWLLRLELVLSTVFIQICAVISYHVHQVFTWGGKGVAKGFGNSLCEESQDVNGF